MARKFKMTWFPPRQCCYPWIPDRGDGRYRNPVIFAEYSDRDVIRVGKDYWLAASSFTDCPGLPILPPSSSTAPRANVANDVMPVRWRRRRDR